MVILQSYLLKNFKLKRKEKRKFKMANIALLIAGGTGNRMGQSIPKQFLTVNERPVIVYTLEAFQKHPEIDVIAVAVLMDGSLCFRLMRISLISQK